MKNVELPISPHLITSLNKFLQERVATVGFSDFVLWELDSYSRILGVMDLEICIADSDCYAFASCASDKVNIHVRLVRR